MAPDRRVGIVGVLLADGQAVESGPLPEVITGKHLGRAFGAAVTVGRFSGRYFAVARRGGGAGEDRTTSVGAAHRT